MPGCAVSAAAKALTCPACWDLQALGLAVLMARSGLPVPAKYPAVLPPFSAVLADIGDEQSLSSSLSTFSGHLKRIQAGPCSSHSLHKHSHSRATPLCPSHQ